ncbi:hypothetical protein CTI12_AA103160 [Artemisia annua]|uniref:Ty3 transposon capsid-like protein domain-containing protein n=1 Tax=Artemisia annua TaxID=35608 RepID=A0A2U1PWV7_ARTAN|nr:hypothetical protein CTI12_AA103160 [Artemisia annua]
MTNTDDKPFSQDDLATKVDKLASQLESIMGWIQAQPSTQPKAHETPLKETYGFSGFDDEDEDDENGEDINKTMKHDSHHPFKVEAKIDIRTYDGTIDAEKLDSWLDQLETYFTLYGFRSSEKVVFAQLKLTSHALAWWNSQLKIMGNEEISWKKFTLLLRQEFYPMGYVQDRWTRWHNLRLQRGQSVQEYTTEFRRLAVTLGIPIDNVDVFTKYVAGLPLQIQNEIRLHVTTNISNASSIAMAIEQKNKVGGRKFEEGLKSEASNSNHQKEEFKKRGATNSVANKYCDTCKISGHTEENCWKVHPELFPKKWIKDDRSRKRTTATARVNDVVELESVKEADKSLFLMTKQKEKSSTTKDKPDEKEELFTLNIQVKHEVIDAIIDPGSEKNLISATLVERLGLETTPHPHPYSLGWIKNDVDTQVNRQCKFRFAITNQFIDEVVCEVVPLDVCQVIFGSPYLWELDAIYFRRAQKYQFEKDGKKYLVNRSKGTRNVELLTACQARRMVNASQVVLLTLVRPMESSNKISTLNINPTLAEDVCDKSPNRVIGHDIQLIADSTLPSIGMYQNSIFENDRIKRHDRRRVEGKFEENDLAWLHLGKERVKCDGKKNKLISYEPLQVHNKISDYECQQKLSTYTENHAVVNVDKLKFFEPSVSDEKSGESSPSVNKLVNAHENIALKEKRQLPSEEKWFSKEVGEANCRPYLEF